MDVRTLHERVRTLVSGHLLGMAQTAIRISAAQEVDELCRAHAAEVYR